jgi:6-phosphogluconolactonase
VTFVEYPDAELLMMGLADRLASDLKSCLMTHDRATFCVPGGTTPGPVFDVLSAVHLDWDRVAVVLSDERWVAEDSPRSNTRLVRERLLVGPAAAARLLPLRADTATPEEALPALIAGLVPHLPLSVLLLGHGGGHAHRLAVSRRRPSGRGAGARCAAADGDARPRRARAAGDADRAGAGPARCRSIWC